MAARRQEFIIVMETAQGEQVHADAVADALVCDLQSDAVERWAGGVRALIAAAPRDTARLADRAGNRRAIEVRELEAQIDELQNRLKELKTGG